MIEKQIQKLKPKLLILDSIQTVYMPEVSSAPGSVSQLRECTGQVLQWAKGLEISIIVVGHVTKDGSVAGPRVLEHMVDTVLFFEGERHNHFRILRALKNRFGSTMKSVFLKCRNMDCRRSAIHQKYFYQNVRRALWVR